MTLNIQPWIAVTERVRALLAREMSSFRGDDQKGRLLEAICVDVVGYVQDEYPSTNMEGTAAGVAARMQHVDQTTRAYLQRMSDEELHAKHAARWVERFWVGKFEEHYVNAEYRAHDILESMFLTHARDNADVTQQEYDDLAESLLAEDPQDEFFTWEWSDEEHQPSIDSPEWVKLRGTLPRTYGVMRRVYDRMLTLPEMDL